MPKRRGTERDLTNLVARLAVEQSGRNDAGRQAFRALPANVQGEIHGMAADDRQRIANGTTITD